MVFWIRTVALFVGIAFLWKGVVLLWEMRPIRRKKYTEIVDATVTELTEERRSASMYPYYMPRFEYEVDGETKSFMPDKSYRPCRLKLGGEVILCLGKRRRIRSKLPFRTIRKNVTPAKSTLFLIIGAFLIITQTVI